MSKKVIKFTDREVKIHTLNQMGKTNQEIATLLKMSPLQVTAILKNINKKIERKYLEELPDFSELEKFIKDMRDTIIKFNFLVKSDKVSQEEKDDITKNKLPELTARLANMQFALNMGIKGYILGKMAHKENAEKISFGQTLQEDNDEKKRTTNNGDKS